MRHIGNAGWTAAAFAGGAAISLILSRMLPPFAAQMNGMLRTAAGADPFAPLERDHRIFRKLLAAMERSTDDAVYRRTQGLFRLKRRLAAHALAEENAVYPLLASEEERADRARQLYAEHAGIKVHLHALETLPKDSAVWNAHLRDLATLIEDHARDEEQVEFPRLRRRLDAEKAASLAGRIQREKAFIL